MCIRSFKEMKTEKVRRIVHEEKGAEKRLKCLLIAQYF